MGKIGYVLMLTLLLAGAAWPVAAAVDEVQPLAKEVGSVEERRLIVQIRQQQQANEKRSKELEQKKIELNLLRDEVDKKIAVLQQLRKQIEKLLAEKSAREQEKVAQLSKMYNKMDPAKAASIITNLDTELAIGILGGMKPKSAGRVLSNLEGERAAELCKAYSTLKKD